MIFRRMTVAAASLATLGAATAVVPAQAAPTGEPCYSYNKRTVENTVIRLWRCNQEPGANGRVMYFAEISNAKPGEFAFIRYRTTNNNATLDWIVNWTQGSFVYTNKFYGNPQELQACANIRHDGDWVEFACAWTFDDDNPGT